MVGVLFIHGILGVFGIRGYTLANDSTVVEILRLGDITVELRMPVGYAKRVQRYDEHIFFIYQYPDLSYIMIAYGSMLGRPILTGDRYVMQIERKKNVFYKKAGFSSMPYWSRSGSRVEDGKCWREDTYYEYKLSVAYDGVPCDKAKVFEEIMNAVLIIRD